MARLLLVDDNSDHLDILGLFLNGHYAVSKCGSAAEALEAIDHFMPDVLLLDIGMAPIDGVQCLEAIRGLPECSSIPAIAVTAYARDVDRESFLSAGFEAVVTKPVVEPAELIAVVKSVLTRSREPVDTVDLAAD